MDSKTLVTLAFLDAFGAEQSLLTYFADLSGPALRYFSDYGYHSDSYWHCNCISVLFLYQYTYHT